MISEESVTTTLLVCFPLEFFLRLEVMRVHFVFSCSLKSDLNVVSLMAFFGYSDYFSKVEFLGRSSCLARPREPTFL